MKRSVASQKEVDVATMSTACIFTLVVLTAPTLRAAARSDAKTLNFTELANVLGYVAEEHEVKTEDDYILGLFRIPGRRGLPVLLMHGLLDTSDTWLLRGRESLGATLAGEGYDVWFGNVRGNKYSRRHARSNPDVDPSFWDFTYDEHGYYDLAAIIDAVLAASGAPQLYAFGHSQGNEIFYVLGSTRPEYNERVKVLTALAPVAYLDHVPPPLSWIIDVAPEIKAFAKTIGVNEVFGNETATGRLLDFVCNAPLIRYELCALGVLFPIAGFDLREFEPRFYDVAVRHFPDSTSIKNLYHYAQAARGHRFASYDYEAPYANFAHYGAPEPPAYALGTVTMPVVLLAAGNDRLAVVADADRLRAELPNVLSYTVIDFELMNHFDFVWGAHMDRYLFPHIFRVLEGND